MKRLIRTCLLLFFLASCNDEAKKTDYIWTGQEYIRNLIPACIIWYKKVPPPIDAWKPYKAFNQTDANDMRQIVLGLTRPEEKYPNPNIESKDKLSMIFYNGFPEKLTVREVYFQIKDKTFIGPVGRSDNLAKILLDKKEVRSNFYYPYRELGSSHYSDSFHRILESQDFLRKQVKQLKAEKQTENQKRIEEPNQAEQ